MSVNIKQSGSLKQIAAFLPNNLITVSSLPDTDITNVQPGQSLVYDGELSKWVNYSAKIILTYDNYFQGEIITCTQGQTVISKTAPLSENTLVFYVNTIGTWVISNGDFSVSVVVSVVGDIVLAKLQSVPQGSTVTPTDDIQTWLACANIRDKSYTTLAEVLADRSTFETLIADSNACDYMARSTSWALAEGLVPTMTSDNTPSGQVTGTTPRDTTTYNLYKALDNNDTTQYQGNVSTGAGSSYSLGYIQYQFANPVNISMMRIMSISTLPFTALKVEVSSDGTAYNEIYNESVNLYDSFIWLQSATNVSYVKVTMTQRNNTSSSVYFPRIYTLQFYEADITRNQDAMALIGKYDYCSNALLGNATWASAISNSDYFEEVLNVKVPVMTSNTTPSGECIRSSIYGSGWEAYRAFDNNSSTRWNGDNTISTAYIGYRFPKAVCVNRITMHPYYSGGGAYAKDYIVQGSNDGFVNDINNIYSGTFPNSDTTESITFYNNTNYKDYRVYFSTTYRDGYSLWELQFYGRSTKTVYKELIPTMTGYTTPSGEAYGSSEFNQNNLYWRAFDGTSQIWAPSTQQAGEYVAYAFESPVKAVKVITRGLPDNSTRYPYSFKIQASNVRDFSVIGYESDTCTVTANADTEFSINPSEPYKYYRMYMLTYTLYISISKFQLIGQATQTNIVHSCANDTIYYMDNGSPVIVATTNSDGDGVLDFSSLDEGVYTFYSSVAKNPNNLTLDFCKRIRVTNTQYGETTEAYLLPDTIDTLYWYGYEPIAMGATAHTNTDLNRTAPTLTNYTNYKSIYQPSGSRGNGYYTKSREADYLHLTLSGSTSTTNQYNSAHLGMNSVNTGVSGTENTNFIMVYPRNTASIPVTNTKHSIVNNDYIVLQVTANSGNVTLNQYAMWYDRVSSDIPTFISAPNDMLYILDGATKIYIANTNGEGKSYEPLLSAGTYTIYSSIAKDPSNLSNPYSKTITVTEGTQTIALIPENTLYWWGYESDNLEDMSSANGWSGYSYTAPTHNTNYIHLAPSSGSYVAGVATKNMVKPSSSVKCIYKTYNSSSEILYGGQTKNITSGYSYESLTSLSMALGVANDTSNSYKTYDSANARNADLYAFWYE